MKWKAAPTTVENDSIAAAIGDTPWVFSRGLEEISPAESRDFWVDLRENILYRISAAVGDVLLSVCGYYF